MYGGRSESAEEELRGDLRTGDLRSAPTAAGRGGRPSADPLCAKAPPASGVTRTWLALTSGWHSVMKLGDLSLARGSAGGAGSGWRAGGGGGSLCGGLVAWAGAVRGAGARS